LPRVGTLESLAFVGVVVGKGKRVGEEQAKRKGNTETKKRKQERSMCMKFPLSA
jgi:hypothetical protein